MDMITKFEIFESQNRDIMKVSRLKTKDYESDSELLSYITNDINQQFRFDTNLITSVIIWDENLKFAWNNRPDHNIYKKIKERTHLKSISEFNDIFEKTIKQVIPSKLGKSGIDIKGCYAFYLKENEFYIMIEIDPEALINGYRIGFYGQKLPYHNWVVTVHNNSTLKNYKYYKKIDIDDSYFNI
jgi:hypothetical protein